MKVVISLGVLLCGLPGIVHAAECTRSCQTCPARSAQGHYFVDVQADCGADLADNSTDDTLCVQDALNCAESVGGTAYFPAGVYNVQDSSDSGDDALVIDGSMTMLGEGDGSLIVLEGAGNSDDLLLVDIETNQSVSIKQLTFDGRSSFRGTAPETNLVDADLSGSTSGPATLTFNDCAFLDVGWSALYLSGDDSAGADRVLVSNSRFIGGQPGAVGYDPQYIQANMASSLVVTNNVFDFGAAPDIGRAGITITAFGGETRKNSAIIKGNLFRNLGRDEANSTLGVVDFYAIVDRISVVDNIFEDSHAAPIRGKTDARSVVITGNHIYNSRKQGIFLTPSVQSQNGGQVSILGNIIRDVDGQAILIQGRSSASYTNQLSIVNNIIDGVDNHPVYQGNGIEVQYVRNFQISSNSIHDIANAGIRISRSTNIGMITSNLIRNTGQAGISVHSSVSGMRLSVLGNSMASVTKYGIYLNDPHICHVQDNMVDGVTASGGTQTAFYVRNCAASTINNNVIGASVATNVNRDSGGGHKYSDNSWQ